MSVIVWLVIAGLSFQCMDLFSNDWFEGAFCPILFGIAVFALLLKLVSRFGSGSGDGFDGGGEGGWFDGDGGGGDGGGD